MEFQKQQLKLKVYEKKILLSLFQYFIFLFGLAIFPGYIYVYDNYDLFLKLSTVHFPQMTKELIQEQSWIRLYYFCLFLLAIPFLFSLLMGKFRELRQEIMHELKMQLTLHWAENQFLKETKDEIFLNDDPSHDSHLAS